MCCARDIKRKQVRIVKDSATRGFSNRVQKAVGHRVSQALCGEVPDKHIALATRCLGHTVPNTCVPSALPRGCFFHAINSHL